MVQQRCGRRCSRCRWVGYLVELIDSLWLELCILSELGVLGMSGTAKQGCRVLATMTTESMYFQYPTCDLD